MIEILPQSNVRLPTITAHAQSIERENKLEFQTFHIVTPKENQNMYMFGEDIKMPVF
jgi:hypothetical protein